jgi:putative ABC transport system substrate-binding protein
MRRREFISLLAALASASAARAQAPPARIAFLGSGAAEASGFLLQAFQQGLQEVGLRDGKDYVLEVRWAERHYERFPALAADLASLHPSVMIVTTIAAARAAQRLDQPIPLVMTGLIDPVGAGLVQSLSRPGGNTTGLSNLAEEFAPKLLEFLHETLPNAAAIAVLYNPANSESVKLMESTRAHAGSINATVEPAPFTGQQELPATFAQLALKRPDALLIVSDIALLDTRAEIAQLALEHRLAAFSAGLTELAEAGVLVGYGPPRRDVYRRAAWYVKRILEGAKPADLPIEQPTTLHLVVNLKTAKALGLTVPQSLFARADEVIE